MSYQWKVGELAVCVDDEGSRGMLKSGGMYCVREVRAVKDCVDMRRFTGVGLLVFGVPEPVDAFTWASSRFRPLHGTDIRKLEEKCPEYVIKTNEVEG